MTADRVMTMRNVVTTSGLARAAQLPRWEIRLTFVWSLHLYSYFVCVTSEASDESALHVHSRGPTRYKFDNVHA